jgi:hypothetical protein
VGSILKADLKKDKKAELAAADLKVIQEAIAMSDEIAAFDQWVEEMGRAAKWRAGGEDRGKKSAWQEAVDLLKQGRTVEDLERISPPASVGK